MRKVAVGIFILTAVGLLCIQSVYGSCEPTWSSVFTANPCPNPDRHENWKIKWADGGGVTPRENSAFGECCGVFTTTECKPRFDAPYTIFGGNSRNRYVEWRQTAYDRECIIDITGNYCELSSGPKTITATRACPRGGCNQCELTGTEDSVFCLTTNNLEDNSCCSNYEASECTLNGGVWDEFSCTCISPIVIDVLGNGFNLTNAQNGVLFDILNTGSPRQVAWTAFNSDDAWLALDRNENDKIDNGRELFGSSSPQPFLEEGESKNGFRALSVYDKAANGGNGDGQIDSRDAIFSSLRLWRDANHNGVSEQNELKTLAESGLKTIDLDYKESKKQDEHGNWFRYRAKVKDTQDAQLGRWAWDVYLKTAP